MTDDALGLLVDWLAGLMVAGFALYAGAPLWTMPIAFSVGACYGRLVRIDHAE